jgi:hypothetical protein
MNIQLDGVYSHNCVDYLRTKLIQKKDKSNFLKQSKKFESDIHKVFCKGSCETCSGDKETHLLPHSEIPYDERVLSALKLGIRNLADLTLTSGYLVESNVVKRAQEELIVERFSSSAIDLIHLCDQNGLQNKATLSRDRKILADEQQLADLIAIAENKKMSVPTWP